MGSAGTLFVYYLRLYLISFLVGYSPPISVFGLSLDCHLSALERTITALFLK